MQKASEQQWLVTGANGNLGRRFVVATLSSTQDRIRAVVRSAQAAKQLTAIELTAEQRGRLDVRVLDYTDQEALLGAAQGCSRALHLVGILKATKSAPYAQAHEASAEVMAKVCDHSSIEHLTYLSILGSTASSPNACLASKGRAEDILLSAATLVCVLRVPMVLGEGDYASRALLARGAQARSLAFRPQSLEQPIYAGDVIQAVTQAALLKHAGALDLAGAESLSRKDLLQRVAACMGKTTVVMGLPIALGYALASCMQALLANPPLTSAMLGVLDHDDAIDPAPALQALQMQALCSVDTTINKLLAANLDA